MGQAVPFHASFAVHFRLEKERVLHRKPCSSAITRVHDSLCLLMRARERRKCASCHMRAVIDATGRVRTSSGNEVSVALCEFRDSSGIEWKVWDTAPERLHSSPASDRALGELRGGWITFSSVLGRRRLAPVPEGWANLPTHELERLCAQAIPTKRQSGELDTPTVELEAVRPDVPHRRSTE